MAPFSLPSSGASNKPSAIQFAACVVGVVFLAGCGGEEPSEDAGATRGDEASSSWTVPSDEEMAELARQQIAKQQRALGAPAPPPAPGPGPATTMNPLGPGANPAPAPAPVPVPVPVARPVSAPAPVPVSGSSGSVLRPAGWLRLERVLLEDRTVATGAAGAVLGEIAEYVVFDADVIGDDQWFEAMEDLFADRGLVGEQVAERQRHGELLRAGGRQPRGLFATALCAMSQPTRSAPGDFSDGHDLRVVTLWWASFSDGDAVPSGTVQDLSVAKATIWERWFVYAVGPRRSLSPAGVAAEVARCEQPLDAEALADDGSALRSRVLNAPDTAARIVGLLRYAAPAATAAVTEWERVVVDAAAPQYAHLALEGRPRRAGRTRPTGGLESAARAGVFHRTPRPRTSRRRAQLPAAHRTPHRAVVHRRDRRRA